VLDVAEHRQQDPDPASAAGEFLPNGDAPQAGGRGMAPKV
jgi:hypothetical protein